MNEDDPTIMSYDFGDLSQEEITELLQTGKKVIGFDPGFDLVLKDPPPE